MQKRVLEGTGILGMEVQLSVQNCIVIKELINQMQHATARIAAQEPVSDSEVITLMTKAFIALDKISGEITSLDDASVELFDTGRMVDTE